MASLIDNGPYFKTQLIIALCSQIKLQKKRVLHRKSRSAILGTYRYVYIFFDSKVKKTYYIEFFNTYYR